MRIRFLSHYFPPEVNAPATRTYEHCVRWARAGHDVTIVTCAPNCPDGVLFDGYQNRLRPQVEVVDGVRVVRVWTYLAPNAGTLRRIANYVSYLVSAVLASTWLARPDIVVATSWRLVGTHRLATRAIGRQEQLLFLNSIFHVSATAIIGFLNRLAAEGFGIQRRDHENAGWHLCPDMLPRHSNADVILRAVLSIGSLNRWIPEGRLDFGVVLTHLITSIERDPT